LSLTLSQAQHKWVLQVVVRVRPPLPREINGYKAFENGVLVDPNQRMITISENLRALGNNGVENGLVSLPGKLTQLQFMPVHKR
jgi:hypothetical protein